jgi:hypothetical protein
VDSDCGGVMGTVNGDVPYHPITQWSLCCLFVVEDVISPILKKAVQQAAHNITISNSCVRVLQSALICRKICGVIGRRSHPDTCNYFALRILFSTNVNLGIGVDLGSGRSLEMCRCLIAARYVLISNSNCSIC